MAVVPTLPPITSTVLPTTTLAAIARVQAFFLTPPIAKLRQTVAQPLTTSTFTPLTFDAEDLDQNLDGVAQHDNATNNSRFTAAYAGWYELLGAATFASNATGFRQAVWAVNGSLILDYFTNAATISGNAVYVAARGQLVFLNVGDYVELNAWQNSGGSLNTVVATGTQSSMICQWRSN